MERKYGEFVGVDNLHYAEVTTDTSVAYVADTPAYLAPAAEIAGAPEINNKSTYYDNAAANAYITEGTTPLTVTVSGIPASLAAKLLGKKYDAASGRVLDTGKPNPPPVALGFRFNKGADDYRYYWYLKGKFSGGSEEAATKTNDVDVRTYQLTYTAFTTAHTWTIDGEDKPMKRIFGDTDDEAFDADGWFDEVQTPDTTSAPSAIALSSIVPADDASGVSVGSTVVLTFNNKIAEDEVMIISAAGAAVAATKAYDATGKILTITPASNLSSSTTYIVAVAGVMDIYGQALAATAKNFST
ncbi:hypothetical protein SDC9_73760 [bioreactor metagenome]|uniref:SbsA Ig-like domain-containing protein n=1 Tax=bioreactor metagenome TaxID=1076179 RepID=A0A644YFN4_9ZZZZ